MRSPERYAQGRKKVKLALPFFSSNQTITSSFILQKLNITSMEDWYLPKLLSMTSA